MNFFRKTQGAVSIFLIIILLPTMTAAGLFLDVSRVSLSKEVVSTSADLALNTVLSDYDKKLKDYFGLLASSQNTEDVIEQSKKFFVDSMVSQGVSTSALDEYFNEITSAIIGDDDIKDVLRLSVDGEVSVSSTKNGAMDNPALVKNGIIEFMKYRAPVNEAEKLFSKFSKSNVAEKVENASAETKLIEAKKNFYEAEEALVQQAEKAYNAVKEYENYKTNSGMYIGDEEFLNGFSQFINSPDGTNRKFEEIYKEAHERMLMNLYNTHTITSSGAINLNLIQIQSITGPGKIDTYSETNKASETKVKKLLKGLDDALKNYKEASERLDTAWGDIGGMRSSDYPIQYWVALTNACSSAYSGYAEKASALLVAAAKLENAIEYADEGVMDAKANKSVYSNSDVTYPSAADGSLSLQSVADTLLAHYANYKWSVTSDRSSSFKKVTSQISQLNTDVNKAKLERDTVKHIYNIGNKIQNYVNDFKEASKKAKDARDEVTKLIKLLDDYRTAFDKWEAAANSPELTDESELAKTDREEIAELNRIGVDKFSKESVEELSERLDNICSLLNSLKEDLEGIKYNGTAILEVRGYPAFRNTANVDDSKIVRNEEELRAYVSQSFKFEIEQKIQRIEIYDNRTSDDFDDGDAYVITDSFHLNLQKKELELYEWMKNKFENPDTSKSVTKEETGFDVNSKKSAKEVRNALSNKSEETATKEVSEAEVGHSFSEWSGATLPSKGSYAVEQQKLSAKLEEISNYVSSIFSNFTETFLGSLVNMRDDLYMMDYVFGMFTYDTFDKEGCYESLSKSKNAPSTPAEASSKYSAEMSKWSSSKGNKTLTLTPRNAANNWAYRGEVEYILYGNESTKTNIETAYARIYMIRYALDLSAVFTTYWDDPVLNSLAYALEAFAYVPASLTKTLACLSITAAEAGIDIQYLKAGLAVPLFKNKENLVCSYESLFMGGSNSVSQVANDDELSLQYSEYLKIFLFTKLVGSGENAIYNRTADVIQANMALSTGNGEYSLSKAQVYYDFEASVLVEPMWSRLLAIDNLGDLSTEKNWRSIKISMTRGY